MKDAYYFPHDSNTQNDPKIILLLEKHNPEGVGIYWLLIEILRDQGDYRCPLALIPSLANRWNTSKEKVEQVVKNFELFEIGIDNYFLSPSLCRRMAIADAKRKKLSDAGKLGNKLRWHPDKMSLSQPDGNPITRKGKEKKRKLDTASNKLSVEANQVASFIKALNEIRGTKYKSDSGTKIFNKRASAFREARRQYSEEQLIDVVKRCHEDHFLEDVYKTPEYCLRENVIERYLNQKNSKEALVNNQLDLFNNIASNTYGRD